MSSKTKIISLLLSLIMIISILNVAPFSVSAEKADTVATGVAIIPHSTPIRPGNLTVVNITYGGEIVYFSFTPDENMRIYFFSSLGGDTYGYLYDENMDWLASDDDSGEASEFKITYDIKAGKTYYLGAKFFDSNETGSFDVMLTVGQEYTDSGETGSCIWEVKGTELTISGNGPMGDYPDDKNRDAPWRDLIITEVIIENGVTSIGASAFRRCSCLKKVTIGDSVQTIRSGAFLECRSLMTVTLPDSVTSIGRYSFEGCSGLTSINIPDGVTYVGDCAFMDCKNINSVTLPKSVKTVESDAFGYYYDYDYIKIKVEDFMIYGYSGTAAETYAIENDFIFISRGKITSGTTGDCTWELNGTELTISGKRKMADYNRESPPWGVDITKVTITDGVTHIGKGSFSDCSKLSSINISNTVKTIGSGAFFNCSGLTSIRIPDSVTRIYEETFALCTSLREVTIPDSVREIYYEAFALCTSLRKITIPKSVKTIEFSAFRNCNNLRSVTIPASVISIGKNAFGYYYDENDQLHKVSGFTIYGEKDSAAEQYAKDNGFTFIEIGDEPKPALGDADGDGDVTALDVTYIQRAAANLYTGIDEDVLMNGDVDGNGALEIIDATFIQRHLAMMGTPYAIGEEKE